LALCDLGRRPHHPDLSVERLVAVEKAVNAAISDDRPVRAFDMVYDEAEATAGLVRAKSVAPPGRPTA